MLTTIQDLEHDIEQFHKNIKDSNELMKILMSVVTMSKTQTESFDVRTKELQDELAKLPPELSELFQEKTKKFLLDVHNEHQAYQDAVEKIMISYSNKFNKSETAILDIPATLESHLKKAHRENVDSLNEVQEQYSLELKKANDAFYEQLQVALESIQEVPKCIADNCNQQYSMFLKELERVMELRLKQLSDTENQVVELSKQLERKYDAFVAKLEATNMDQLYKFCQDMNKSINTKLTLALGGVAVAVVISVISLFI